MEEGCAELIFYYYAIFFFFLFKLKFIYISSSFHSSLTINFTQYYIETYWIDIMVLLTK